MTTGGTTTNYVYDFGGSLPMVLTDGVLTYTYGLGLAYTVDGSGNVQVFHPDALGSVRALTDGSGNLLQTFQTDEFGNPVLTQGTNTEPFRYTGQQWDAATGLYYLRARYYWPSIGRFVSRDTLFGSTATPLSLNRFTYVTNNPVNAVDPGGQQCEGGAAIEEFEGEGASLGCAGAAGMPISTSDPPPGNGAGSGNEGPNAVANAENDFYKWLKGLLGGSEEPTTPGSAEESSGPVATPGTTAGNPAWINIDDLPPAEGQAVSDTVSMIDGNSSPPQSGTLQAVKWGIGFQNNNDDLPVEPKGYYSEYRVLLPGDTKAGVLRVVKRNGGEIYYTWTHYGDTGYPPFVRLR